MASLLEANESFREVFKRGMSGWDVIALQVALNSHYPSPNLALDGSFGPATERAVRQLQEALHITVDGVAGPETQSRFCGVKCDRTRTLVPAGLVKGVCFGESGGLFASTSPLYSDGSRDYGPLQDHERNPSEATLEACYNPEVEAWKVAGIIAHNHQRYVELHRGLSAEDLWKGALFAYNWPVGADIIAKGEVGSAHYIENDTGVRRLMTDAAPWIEAIGAHFPDGRLVRTGMDWYQRYVGTKDQFVTGWSV